MRPLSDHNGGINGGITNGGALRFCCAVKPTPSVAREQQTVDLETRTPQTLTVKGRHDPVIVHRARVVVDSVTALGLADLIFDSLEQNAGGAEGTVGKFRGILKGKNK